MNIRLKNIIPVFLEGNNRIESEVWNTDLTFRSGQRVLIKAHSGKGKSTLLGLIFGIRKWHTGSLFLNDVDTSTWSRDQWADWRQQHASILFQELRLFETLTVRENFEVRKSAHSNWDFNLAQQWLHELGLGEMMDRPVTTLSYGQQQRVALVRSLLQPFHWLLLDEPFSHLDDSNRFKCEQLIQRVCAERGAGYIVTSLGSDHDFTYDSKYLL